jgi:hypothetical protein
MSTPTKILFFIVVVIAAYFAIRVFLATFFWFFGSLSVVIALGFLIWLVIRKNNKQ